MPVRGPEENWADIYRPGDEPEDKSSPEWAEWRQRVRKWRENAALNGAWRDEQLGMRDDITDEASLGRALNELGIFNRKEEGQAGFRGAMQRGLGYQRNLVNQNRDYYTNLWGKEGLEAVAGRPGLWKDVRPDGSIMYRDAMGYTTDANGKRTGQHYAGKYTFRGNSTGSPTYGSPGPTKTPPPPGTPPPTTPGIPPDNPPGGGPGGGGSEPIPQSPLRLPGMPSFSGAGIPQQQLPGMPSPTMGVYGRNRRPTRRF